jgi:ribosome biogenesis GTPase A
MTIQWFPGHMTKARRQVEEKLPIIDVVIELLDARVPISSRNPMINAIVQKKPRLVLLNKKDLADARMTEKWEKYFSDLGLAVHPIDSLNGSGVHRIPALCMELTSEMQQKRVSKGLQPRNVRAMIVGIPNVGKSSLINRLTKRNVAQTGDRPGVTKAQQWIKGGDQLELLDTPGILWPKFEDPMVGYRLAATGAIKDELLDKVDISMFVIEYYRTHYPDQLMDRYKLENIPEDKIELLELIGRKRGCLVSGGHIDYDKVAELILRELRSGKLGRFTLEDPEEIGYEEQ